VVELNRAVALAMLFGPAAGLELIDKLTLAPALKAYHLLPSVRGDLLKKLGRLDEARAEFEHAAQLTRNERERKLLRARIADCADGTQPRDLTPPAGGGVRREVPPALLTGADEVARVQPADQTPMVRSASLMRAERNAEQHCETKRK
jgi:hypothetical protein